MNFFSRELALTREFKSKLEPARLFARRQVPDFFNDCGRCHIEKILENDLRSNEKGGDFVSHAA